MSEKSVRRSGEKEAKKDTKTKSSRLGPSKHLNNAFDRVGLQIKTSYEVPTSLSINFDPANEEAKEILKKAAKVAERKKAGKT